jgi:hypothetical protein
MGAELDRGVIEVALAVLEPLAGMGDPDTLDELFGRLGWSAEGLGVAGAGPFAAAAGDIENAIAGLAEVLGKDSIGLEDLGKALAPLATAITALLVEVGNLQVPPTVPQDAPQHLVEDLGGFLLEHFIASRAPKVGIVLGLFGLWKTAQRPALTDSTGPVVREAVTRRVLDLTALGEVLRDPLGYLRHRFVVDPQGVRRTADAVADLLGPEIAELLAMAGANASYGVLASETALTPAERALAERFLVIDTSYAVAAGMPRGRLRLVVGLTNDTQGDGLGFLIATSGGIALSLARRFGTFSATLSGTLAPILITSKRIAAADGGGFPAGLEVSIGYASAAAQAPVVRFGSPQQTHFQVGSVAATIRLAAAGTGVDVGGTIDLAGILLSVRGGDGDGFLDRVLPRDPFELTATLGLDVSLTGGVRVRGNGGFERRIAIGKSVGPLVIQEAQIGMRLSEQGLSASLSATVGLAIGPLSATVEAMGLFARLAPPPPGQAAASAGSLGPLDLTLGFKPPSGAGLSIKAGPVTGGGFIFFDPENEQYAGILQLGFNQIGLTVIGLLTTRLPDASGPPGATKKGFSLLLIIAVDLPPIQLGYGFTLNGVGGLLGVHRTMVVDALRNGVRDGSVNSILFPQDPVKRAGQIISQLRSIFPPAEGRFVFGPMVKLGWGPNAILELSAAVVLELTGPIRLVILGRIQAALPDKKSTVLNLRLDIVGVVDFDRGEVSIDASLVDSRLTAFVLTGDMALRAGWGASKIFALAAGGFHPRFQPPEGFPSLRRLAIALGDSDNPRLRMETYLALTANTIQFGAAMDAYVKMDTPLGTFSAAANITFDALIQFQPFELTAELGASIDILRNNVPLLHAALHATFTGPTPWHAIGYAEFDFLGKHRIEFEATAGEPAQPPLIEMQPADVLSEILKAFARADAWAALPPGEASRIVTLRDHEPGATVVVHPLGSLSARQRVLPLGKSVDRFGAATVAPTTFTLAGFQRTTGRTEPPAEDLYDEFAPGQFTALSDDERLARPAFETMRSGGRVAFTGTSLPDDARSGVRCVIDYDEAIVDVDPETGVSTVSAPGGQAASIPDAALASLVHGGAAAAAETRVSGAAGFRGPGLGVSVLPESYVVASADTLAQVPGAPAESSAEAHDRLARRTKMAPPAQAAPACEAA